MNENDDIKIGGEIDPALLENATGVIGPRDTRPWSRVDDLTRLSLEKCYFLFGWQEYDAAGGVNDLIGTYETIHQAIDAADEQRRKWDWAHIATLGQRGLEIVMEYYSDWESHTYGWRWPPQNDAASRG